jgi:hypothetical protein
MQHHQRLSMVGWCMLGWLSLPEEATKVNSICSLGNLINFSLTLLVGGGERLPPSSLIRPKKGGSALLSKQPSRCQLCSSGVMKSPPPPSPSGISSSTNLRQKKRRFSSGRSSIRQSRLTSGTVKSQWRLTKVAHIAALNWWNQWNIGSTAIHSLNMGGNTLPTSLGNSLLKIKKILKNTWPMKIHFYDAKSL